MNGWSKTQILIALSSGGSEFYSVLKASAEAFGMLPMFKDLGWKLGGEMWGDANVALGTINKRSSAKLVI